MNTNEFLFAYIYREDGYHAPKIIIKNDYRQVASFIMTASTCPRTVFTDPMDNFLFDTIYEFIDRCKDKKYLEELLKVLIPMQKGKDKPDPIEVFSWGTDLSTQEMLDFLDREFCVKFNLLKNY